MSRWKGSVQSRDTLAPMPGGTTMGPRGLRFVLIVLIAFALVPVVTAPAVAAAPVVTTTTITDPLNHVTVNSYDALNRLVQVTAPGSTVTAYGYNALDQLID